MSNHQLKSSQTFVKTNEENGSIVGSSKQNQVGENQQYNINRSNTSGALVNDKLSTNS